MRRLNVSLGERSYPILIGSGLLTQAELLLELLPARRAVIIITQTVAPLYLETLALP